MKKHVALLFLILSVCGLLCSGCSDLFFGELVYSSESFTTIKKSFDRDCDTILDAVEGGRYDDVTALKWVEEIREHEKCVEFNCCSRGMGNRANYAGFFYTPVDDPLAMWRHDISANYAVTADDFEKTEDGWEYRAEDHGREGNHRIVVRQLTTYYYYYHIRY